MEYGASRYSYAANNLFDHYEQKDVVQARRILTLMLEHLPEPGTYLRAIRFYCNHKEEGEALECFQRLLRCHDESHGIIKAALDALVKLKDWCGLHGVNQFHSN